MNEYMSVINEMIEIGNVSGISYDEISKKSDIPLVMIKGIMSGTMSPTVRELLKILCVFGYTINIVKSEV